jgi:hypothetical protein
VLIWTIFLKSLFSHLCFSARCYFVHALCHAKQEIFLYRFHLNVEKQNGNELNCLKWVKQYHRNKSSSYYHHQFFSYFSIAHVFFGIGDENDIYRSIGQT